jgi:hypothetical protein
MEGWFPDYAMDLRSRAPTTDIQVPERRGALGHPEKIIDYGYRAVHLTSAVAKNIVADYYGRELSHSYFSGCSDGGRESLMEAQRYYEVGETVSPGRIRL